MKSKIEIYEDKRSEWRWRMKSSNGRIVASSGEGFTRKSSCRESVSNMLGTFARNEYTIIVEGK